LGSFFFLGALLLDLELQPDQPHETHHCGSCTACLNACPTEAFVGPAQLDSRRCISYLTIELRGAVPHEHREDLGDWVFGCDVCQDVCPWNRKAPASRMIGVGREAWERIDLLELLKMSESDFRQRFGHTALMRAGRRGLLRNAALVLAKRGDRRAVTALEKALLDTDPVVREAASWARSHHPACDG